MASCGAPIWMLAPICEALSPQPIWMRSRRTTIVLAAFIFGKSIVNVLKEYLILEEGTTNENHIFDLKYDYDITN